MTFSGNQFSTFRDVSGVLQWRWPDITLTFPPAAPYVAGILNVTPDSFFDGGLYASPEWAAARALEMAGEGAHIIDLGGQSTRPGSESISLAEEEKRVLPALEALRDAFKGSKQRVLISLDTDKPALANRVLRRNLADILNDESGGERAMARVAYDHNVPLILMHRPAGGDRGSVASVMEDLASVRQSYQEAGLSQEYIALDPGLGFGKTGEENLTLLSNCLRLRSLGSPLYIGASRKSFIGEVTGNPDADRRLAGSLAAAVWASLYGASFLRVHDVKETVQALAMAVALKENLGDVI